MKCNTLNCFLICVANEFQCISIDMHIRTHREKDNQIHRSMFNRIATMKNCKFQQSHNAHKQLTRPQNTSHLLYSTTLLVQRQLPSLARVTPAQMLFSALNEQTVNNTEIRKHSRTTKRNRTIFFRFVFSLVFVSLSIFNVLQLLNRSIEFFALAFLLLLNVVCMCSTNECLRFFFKCVHNLMECTAIMHCLGEFLEQIS